MLLSGWWVETKESLITESLLMMFCTHHTLKPEGNIAGKQWICLWRYYFLKENLNASKVMARIPHSFSAADSVWLVYFVHIALSSTLETTVMVKICTFVAFSHTPDKQSCEKISYFAYPLPPPDIQCWKLSITCNFSWVSTMCWVEEGGNSNEFLKG